MNALRMGRITKAWLRRASARTLGSLSDAVTQALRAVADDECRNYSNACGYGGS